jgi:hypothetical protein
MRLGFVVKATALFAEMSETLLQPQDRLEPVLGRRSRMHTLNRRWCLGIAAAGAFGALTAVSLLARAEDAMQHLGPVGPHEPILTTFGDKRVIAFYQPDSGRCAVNAVVFEKTDPETGMTTAARVRVELNPRQIVHIDSSDNKTINLRCGDRAETLALVDNGEPVASGLQQATPPMKASASGF